MPLYLNNSINNNVYQKYYLKCREILININCDTYPAWKMPRDKTSLNCSVNIMNEEYWQLYMCFYNIIKKKLLYIHTYNIEVH